MAACAGAQMPSARALPLPTPLELAVPDERPERDMLPAFEVVTAEEDDGGRTEATRVPLEEAEPLPPPNAAATPPTEGVVGRPALSAGALDPLLAAEDTDAMLMPVPARETTPGFAAADDREERFEGAALEDELAAELPSPAIL